MSSYLPHRRKAFRATGGAAVFDETWNSATPGAYTSGAVTGSDEGGWNVTCGAGESFIIASQYGELRNTNNAGSAYLKQNDLKATTVNKDYRFRCMLHANFDHADRIEIVLYDTNGYANRIVLAKLYWDRIIVNGTTYSAAYTLGSWFWLEFRVETTTQKVQIWSDGNYKGELNWSQTNNSNPGIYIEFIQISGTDNEDSLYLDDVIVGAGLW